MFGTDCIITYQQISSSFPVRVNRNTALHSLCGTTVVLAKNGVGVSIVQSSELKLERIIDAQRWLLNIDYPF